MALYRGISSFVLLLVALSTSPSHGFLGTEKKIKSAVFLSPKLVMNPGSVANPFLFDIDFPRGHIGLKGFDAEVVDESGNPVPLHETYLHHWVVQPYYVRKGFELSQRDMPRNHGFARQDPERNLGSRSDYILVKNGGLCRNSVRHYFGLGSETRKTSTYLPDPYAIEFDNPEERPDGYEFKWLLNIHAIDTRSVVDKSGCTECRCDLYNVTIDEYGRALRPGYNGGLYCCYDKTQCLVRSGFDNGEKTRTLYLKYTVRWVDWDTTVLPAKVYILDVTDSWERSQGSTGDSQEHYCHVEYEVKPCKANGDGCVDVKKKSLMMPFNGYIVYGVAHQHAGGIGAALYREDGEGICSSMPKYGNGDEPGNEAGYIVGMSSCYPEPVRVTNGETLTLEFNYSNTHGHTGVMGLFYILVAQQLPEPESSLPALFQAHAKSVSVLAFLAVTVVVAVIVLIAAVVYRGQNREDGYQSLSK
ncbi:hypothetical protein EUTSA_v10004141mg [Eutrema salsugineum]|uniref:Stress up-regulated Nod 19 protein n=1 Tax=Eutrema salsugineum TaxID=72664 RepID=V4K1G7_EUTSA|nr:uncharacterized protein LOC18013147 [Eutrema salsugineum]ESQ31755.1 hypothetical protein EUTSA_v10004141mg [Eutrema salsugineum]